jgi:serine/threonine protein kinase
MMQEGDSSTTESGSSDFPRQPEDEERDRFTRIRRMASVQIPLRCTSDFEVEKMLGSGSYGEVMRVRNKIDHQVYAIKRVAIARGAKIHKRERIMREVYTDHTSLTMSVASSYWSSLHTVPLCNT